MLSRLFVCFVSPIVTIGVIVKGLVQLREAGARVGHTFINWIGCCYQCQDGAFRPRMLVMEGVRANKKREQENQ